MNIVVLTTETLHHCYFVRQLVRAHPVELVVVEHRLAQPPFETRHPFEDRRDDYERAAFFEGREQTIDRFAEALEVETANDDETLQRLDRIKPDAVVVFGTGKLSREVIEHCPQGMVNLHGGDPERYRGLDSHLWAIYHRDYDSLKVTLHRVNERLDDGEIVLQAPLPLRRGMMIHELRRHNTEVCVDLVSSALESRRRSGCFQSRPQRRIGRYYSFMPAVLKDCCQSRFESYTRGL